MLGRRVRKAAQAVTQKRIEESPRGNAEKQENVETSMETRWACRTLVVSRLRTMGYSSQKRFCQIAVGSALCLGFDKVDFYLYSL